MSDSHLKPGAESGSNAGVVIVVALFLLMIPCILGLLFAGGLFFVQLQAPAPMPLPPVPGANAPLPANPLIPPGAAITVNEMKWSGNLFDAADESLTLARYEQIEPGMSYEKVLELLAIPEAKRPPDMELVGPASDVELRWFGGPDDARSITVKMKGKVVTDKSQTGLQ